MLLSLLYNFHFSDNTRTPIGPIVGGVLGGVAALAAIVIILFFILFVLRHKYPVKLLLNSRTRNKGFVLLWRMVNYCWWSLT